MKKVTTPQEAKKVMASKEPVAVFFHMNGCPHCMAMEQPWEELEKEKGDVKFVIVDSDAAPDDVKGGGFPQFKLVKGGQVVAKADGEMPKEQLKTSLFGGSVGAKRKRSRRSLTRRKRKVARRSTRVHVSLRK